MKLSGWKTHVRFDRYNIIDAGELRRAVAQRSEVNGKQNAIGGKQAELVERAKAL